MSEAVRESIKERGSAFEVNPISCNGIEECRVALLRASKGVLPQNFIEGMACKGGCVGGAGCLNHDDKNANKIDEYAKEAVKNSAEK